MSDPALEAADGLLFSPKLPSARRLVDPQLAALLRNQIVLSAMLVASFTIATLVGLLS